MEPEQNHKKDSGCAHVARTVRLKVTTSWYSMYMYQQTRLVKLYLKVMFVNGYKF